MQRKLKGHAYMQAHVDVNEYDGSETLYSYDTAVISKFYGTFNNKTVQMVSCTGLYSRTTINHISLYLRENGISYYLVKAIAGATGWVLVLDDDANPYVATYYNLISGEVVTIETPIKDSQLKKLAKYFEADQSLYYDGWDMHWRHSVWGY